MSFDRNAVAISRDAMNSINPNLTKTYSGIVEFLSSHKEAAAALRGSNAPPIGSAEYIRKQAVAFAKSRLPKSPQKPSTVPDEMVSVILVSYFKVNPDSVERIKNEHMLSMGAENMVGDLLERYLASVMEPHGWLWCSGAMVKAVDFIKPPSTSNGAWQLLQVKNRDNSENSSSSAIRVGTTIQKWHRTFSKKKQTNWSAFPDQSMRSKLSESGFKSFVKKYLESLT